jgi:hypothetical protein
MQALTRAADRGVNVRIYLKSPSMAKQSAGNHRIMVYDP